MHILWQMTVCTQGCRERSGLRDQWMGRTQEGHLLSHLLYVCLCGAYKEKDGASWAMGVGTQPPGNDASAAPVCLPAQTPPAMPLPSNMFLVPWAASAFHSSQWPFYRACKKPSSYVEAGEKMPERNLGTDPESDWSIVYSFQWKTLILRTAAELPPISQYLGGCRLPAQEDLVLSMTRIHRGCG